MKCITTLLFILTGLFLRSQTILFQENFNSSLGQCVATNSANGTWMWSNSCAKSNLSGHTAPGHAIFIGSGCTFGNSWFTTKGDLVTPNIALPSGTCVLSFRYSLTSECSGEGEGGWGPGGDQQNICNFDALTVSVSVNGGTTYTPIATSSNFQYSLSLVPLSYNTNWVHQSLSLAAFAGQTVQIKFNFDSWDGGLNNFDGMYLDDIKVITCSQPQAIPITSQPSTLICLGQSMTLSTTSGGPYLWNTGATTQSAVVTPAGSGFYHLTIDNSTNCPVSAHYSVTVVPAVPALTISAVHPTICLGFGTALNATSNYWPVVWSPSLTTGAAIPSITTTYTASVTNACGTTSSAITVTVVPLQINITSPPATVCASQPVQFSVSSSATNYTWLPGPIITNASSVTFTPSISTNYTVIGKQNLMCFATASVSVTVHPIPVLNLVSTATSICQSSSITLSTSGATSYTWLPSGANGISFTDAPSSTAVYTVTGVNAGGCAATKTLAVEVKPLPSLTLSVSDPLVCAGKNATLIVTGAANYSWSTGSTGSLSIVQPSINAAYTVTGTTNGCSQALSFPSIGVITPVLFASANNSLCTGQSITLTAGGASSYTWNGILNGPNLAVQPTVSTVYTVAAHTTSGTVSCPSSATVLITVHQNPTVIITGAPLLVCRGNMITLGANGAVTYKWHTGANQQTISAMSGMAPLAHFTVTGTDANGCSASVSVSVKVDACMGLAIFEKAGDFLNVYPNPAPGEFVVTSGLDLTVLIINELGQQIAMVVLDASNNRATEIKGIAPGVYLIYPAGDLKKARKVVVH